MRTKEEIYEMAKEFAARHEVEVQEWMLWDGWHLWVGCENCNEGGDDAPCWGRIGCHGVLNGCGCYDCAVDDAFEDLLVMTDIKLPSAKTVDLLVEVAKQIVDGKVSLEKVRKIWSELKGEGEEKVKKLHQKVLNSVI